MQSKINTVGLLKVGRGSKELYFEILNTRFLSPFCSCLTKVIIQVLDHFYLIFEPESLADSSRELCSEINGMIWPVASIKQKKKKKS